MDRSPRPGAVGMTWITGWTGFWVSVMQWVAGDGGLWPFRRIAPGLPRGYPTHVFVLLPERQVLEAQPGGAVISPLERYAGRPVLWAHLPLSPEQEMRIPALAPGYVGIPYNWLNYLYLGLWHLRIRPVWLRERIRGNGQMICSQLVDHFAEQLGLNLFADGRLNQDVTPGDLFDLFDRRKWWRIHP